MYKSLCLTLAVLIAAYYFAPLSHIYPYNLKSNQNSLNASTTKEMALSSISRNVVKKVLAVETPEGAGALVRRSIGSMSLRNLTPFLMLDHFHVTEGAVSNTVGNMFCSGIDKSL